MNKILTFSIILSTFIYSAPYKRTAPQPPKEKPEINAKSKTGFMLGVENGYFLHQIANTSYTTMNVTVGANMGYNVYFTDKVGLRFLGNYTYFVSHIGTNLIPLNMVTDYKGTHRFGFGLDFLYDYYNNKELGLSLGIFAGLGFGYDLNSGANIRNLLYRIEGFFGYATLGLNIIFNSHNRIDIGYRYTYLNTAYIEIDNTNNSDILSKSNPYSSPFALVDRI